MVFNQLKAKSSSLLLRLCCHLLQGYYFTGDGCKRDKDGYFWITGLNSMHKRQGDADSSLISMPASHCVQHSGLEPQDTHVCVYALSTTCWRHSYVPHSSICLSILCCALMFTCCPSIHLSVHPLLVLDVYMLPIHPSVCPSRLVPSSSSCTIARSETGV